MAGAALVAAGAFIPSPGTAPGPRAPGPWPVVAATGLSLVLLLAGLAAAVLTGRRRPLRPGSGDAGAEMPRGAARAGLARDSLRS